MLDRLGFLSRLRAASVREPSVTAEQLKDRGNAHLGAGELEAAADCYRQAIAVAPAYAEAHNNLGVAKQKLGDAAGALASFERAIQLRPNLAQAHLNRGNVLLARTKHDDAIAAFRTALVLDPALAEAHNSLGSALLAAGHCGEALAAFRDAIALDPHLADAHYNLGSLLQEQGDGLAVPNLETAIRLKPDFAEAYNTLGVALKERNELQKAEICFERALELKSDFPEASVNLGLLLYETNHLEAAAARFHRAISLCPDCPAPYSGIGLLLRQLGRLDEALMNLRQAQRLDPQNVDILCNLGLVHQDRTEHAQAIDCYEKALALRPSDGWRRFNLALPMLASGRVADGWDCYTHRFAAGTPRRDFVATEWAGEDLKGKTLLVWGEQGVGDEILFAGLLPEVLAQAGHCVVECTPKLAPLFAGSFPAARIVPRSTPPHPATGDAIDFHCAAGTLAKWLRPSVDSFPARRAYLTPAANRVAYWEARLAELGPGLKVGIGWRGHIPSGVRALYYTSLDQWEPIFAVPGVHFISLQYDHCDDELAAARQRFGVPLHVFDEVDLFDDLAEAAALKQALNLVISAPTATAFLSAAVGVPTWMMSYSTPWQTLGTDHVPWFPAMRCFPRRWDQPWEEVIDGIADQLRGEIT